MDQWALVVRWDRVDRWVLDQMDLWALEVQEDLVVLLVPEDLGVQEVLVAQGVLVVQEDPWDQTHQWEDQALEDLLMK